MTKHNFNEKMLRGIAEKGVRALRCENLQPDLTVVGGGLSGVCTAVTAARQGLQVVLVQDRPVLGGNASSEVRLWALGATSHMGNNNRWAREGGVIDELLVENTFRNREGNPVLVDMVVLDKVLAEKNIRLLLNTVVYDLEKEGPERIKSVTAFNPQNETRYTIQSPLFCDASGDGIVSYLAGASFRFGAEEKEEFGECFSPSDSYGKLLGQTIFLYPKMTDGPVRFTPPDFALKDIQAIPKYNKITPDQKGCNYWWFEYGGTQDTIGDTEEIKMELWKVVYGAWNHIKNSGLYPEAENMTLEWVGIISGKRESRRFEGLYMLSQKDIIEQRHFDDAVAFGGWAIDLHPAAGVYSPLPSCNQYHSKGIYSIPYRCYVSKEIENLFYAGRIISVSHVAFGSTRVMTTCAHGGQAVGMAAALCKETGLLPAAIQEPTRMKELQQRLSLAGQSIPGVGIDEKENKLARASLKASSRFAPGVIPISDRWISLEYSAAQMLPLKKGIRYTFEVTARAEEETTLTAQFCVSSKPENYTPDTRLESHEIELHKGIQTLRIEFSATTPNDQYAFVMFRANPRVKLAASDERYTGILSVFNKFNLAVNNTGKQNPPEGSGFESFEFWCPERRPSGENIAMKIHPALECFGPENLCNGFVRPTTRPNAWVASPGDRTPSLEIRWPQKQTIEEIVLYFDTDYDHPMETVQYGHPESVMPFCIRDLKISDAEGNTVGRIEGNHKTIVRLQPEHPVVTDFLKIETECPAENVPAALFEIEIR